MADRTEIDAIAERLEAMTEPTLIGLEHPKTGKLAPVLILPEGKRPVGVKPFLDDYLEKPERRRETVIARSTGAFVEIVKRFIDGETTAVFAWPDRQKPSCLAVFDYHPESGDVTQAEWREHRARHDLELSEEWKAWQSVHAKPLEQRAFAEFVEDHATDVGMPPADDPKIAALLDLLGGKMATPAELVALSRGLQISTEVKLREAVTLSTGEISIAYEEQRRNGAGQPLQVANLFCIEIPVFFGGAPYRIPVRLRFSTREGALKWSLHLYQADRVFDHAFDEVTRQIGAETGAPVYLGRPE